MSEVVGEAIISPPPLLRTKVAGEVKAIARRPKQAEAVPSEVPTKQLGTPGQNPKSANSISKRSMQISSSQPISTTLARVKGVMGAQDGMELRAPAKAKNAPSAYRVDFRRREAERLAKNSPLPPGIGKCSSMADLLKARATAKRERKGALTEAQRDTTYVRIEALDELIERRAEITKRQSASRVENKRTTRLKRMGCRLIQPKK